MIMLIIMELPKIIIIIILVVWKFRNKLIELVQVVQLIVKIGFLSTS